MFFKRIFLAGIILLLGACADKPQELPELTESGGVITLGVASVDIINEYRPPNTSLHIEHKLTPPPFKRLSAWAEEILIPQDTQGNLLLTISRAALTEEEFPKENRAFFTNEQDRLVKVDLEGIFTFSHPQDRRSATVIIKTHYEHSIAEATTPNDTDRIRNHVTEEAIRQFEQKFRAELNAVSKNGWPKL